MTERDIKPRPWVPEEQVQYDSSGLLPVVVNAWSESMGAFGVGRRGAEIKRDDTDSVRAFAHGWERLISARNGKEIILPPGVECQLANAGVLQEACLPSQDPQEEIIEAA